MNLEKGKRKNWFKQRWYVIAAGIVLLAGAFAMLFDAEVSAAFLSSFPARVYAHRQWPEIAAQGFGAVLGNAFKYFSSLLMYAMMTVLYFDLTAKQQENARKHCTKSKPHSSPQ